MKKMKNGVAAWKKWPSIRDEAGFRANLDWVIFEAPRGRFLGPKKGIEKGEELTINYWTGVKKSKKTGFGAYCLCVDCVKKKKGERSNK